MKKLIAITLTLVTCGSALALPVGNPSEPILYTHGLYWGSYCCEPCDPCFSWFDAWNVRAGFYGDYVFNRHLEVDHKDHENGTDIDDVELYTNSGYLVLNICDRVDIFGTLGATNLHIKTDASSWGAPLSLMSELYFKTDLSWSAGARAVLWGCDCFTLGLEGQYFQVNTEADYFVNYDSGQLNYFNENDSAHYSEWQVGLGVSYRIATNCPTFAMVPYAAATYARSKLDLDDLRFATFSNFIDDDLDLKLEDLDNKKPWGYAIGLSFTMCDLIGVTVEGRFAGEKALYVNGQIRF